MRKCDSSIRRVLVTNATSRLKRDLARLGIGKEFEHVVNSSAVGAAKPDPRIFEIALLRAGARTTETLFIDGTPAHVSGAEKLGITGHVFTRHDELRAFLRRHGVMLSESGQKET